MKKRTILAALLAAAMLFATACQGSGSKDERSKIYVYNWGEYMSRESDTVDFYGQEYELTDVIADFENDFPQYEVEYRMFDENESMYAQLGTVSYDVIIPSDYMIDRLAREDRLQPLDMSLLPNVTQHLDEDLKAVAWTQNPADTERLFEYAVPYLYCTVGLVYNTNEVPAPASTDASDVWAPLFDEAYVNRIGMYNSMRESIGVALNYLGYSLNTQDPAELQEALDLLINQRSTVAPLVGIDELKDKYVSGELVAGVAWSGDHVVIQQRLQEAGEDPESIQYVLPEGSNISVDMMAIPDNAENVEGAHAFINYMYETEVAVKNAVYVGYSSPHTEARKQLPESVTGNESYYPGTELISTLEPYYSSDEIEQLYDELWVQYLAN